MSIDIKSHFRALATRPDDQIELLHAALLIAADEYPALQTDKYLTQIDSWAENIHQRLPNDANIETRVQFLNSFLFKELGFSGNVKNYYDPRNSYLNEVLDRRLGIPITLSVVYLELGQRLGLCLEGVSFPGHFLVKLPYDEGTVVLDPFNGGISLGEQELMSRLKAIFHFDIDDLAPFLTTASNKEILIRMLSNLKGIYKNVDHAEKMLEVINKILLIDPDRSHEYRDRGLLLQSMECYHAALYALQTYLHIYPEAEDAELMREKLFDLQQQHKYLN